MLDRTSHSTTRVSPNVSETRRIVGVSGRVRDESSRRWATFILVPFLVFSPNEHLIDECEHGSGD